MNRDQRRLKGYEIENRLRTALNLDPLNPNAEEDDADALEQEDLATADDERFPPDILLEEAGYILADLIRLTHDVQLVEKSNRTE